MDSMVDLSVARVVVCDDSLTNVLILAKVLEEIGVSSERFTDPRKALQYLQEHGEEIDLLVLDMEMPYLSGLDVMKALGMQSDRGNPQSSIPFAVLVITGLQDRQIRYEALQAGAADFVNKPLDPEEIQLRARNLLRTQLVMRQLDVQFQHAVAQYQGSQRKLVQAEKLASVGQLAAGVAHEINNPIGFVYSNLGALQTYLQSLLSVADAAQNCVLKESANLQLSQLASQIEAADLPWVREDGQQLVRESLTGLQRVKAIVHALQDFARPGVDMPQWVSITECLDAAIGMLEPKQRAGCKLIRSYTEVPKVHCLPTRMEQVFHALLSNALTAIAGKPAGTAEVRLGLTQVQPDRLQIEITDNGHGIAPEHLERIFEPFFTTREVGSGTGLGLSMAWGIIQQHQGEITVSSVPDKGATFVITLPIDSFP